MRKIVAGLAISLGDVAQSPAEWRFRHRNQRTARVSPDSGMEPAPPYDRAAGV
jgi:hypothetical protein